MTQSDLARRPAQSIAQRPFGALPETASNMTLERALELAGVDGTELALLASTTFKHARTLEELVTLVAATRRKGLRDGVLRHVYYERFGGDDSDPSVHVAIDGLRAIAAATGRFGGKTEPRFSGTWEMPIDAKNPKATKPVPAKCVLTVYAIVQGQRCPFEGVAWMDEAYPGPGGRGRMWRQRPRGMLAIAAERQAIRSAFAGETSDIGDYDDTVVIEAQDSSPERTVEENAAEYDRVHRSEPVEPAALPPQPRRTRADMKARGLQLVPKARELGVEIPPAPGRESTDDEIEHWLKIVEERVHTEEDRLLEVGESEQQVMGEID